jgi:hypothetical protein
MFEVSDGIGFSKEEIEHFSNEKDNEHKEEVEISRIDVREERPYNYPCYLPPSSPDPKSLRIKSIVFNNRSQFVIKLLLFMEIHRSKIEIFKTVCKYLFKLYKVIVGTLLSIFTYQSCDILTNKLGCFNEEYDMFVLVFNIMTFVAFMILNLVEVYRESYFIKELYCMKGEDDTLNITTHEDSCGRSLYRSIYVHNLRHYRVTFGCVILYILNFVVSAVLMFSGIFNRYKNYKTITTMFSNMFLLGYDLFNSVSVVKETWKEENLKCVSAYNVKKACYNGINIWERYIKDMKKNCIQKAKKYKEIKRNMK